MDFAYSDDQQALIDLAHQILVDASTPERLKQLERSGSTRFDTQLWDALAKAGLLGVGIPESHGGNGFGFLELAGVVEQVGRTTAAVPYLETMVLGAWPIVNFGSEAQKSALLPRVATGELILTAALVEPEGDPERPTTRAEPAAEGWQLSGTKLCVPFAEQAGWILVPALCPDAVVRIFLVDPKHDGAKATRLVTTSAQPEARLDLDGVAVSETLGGDSGAAIVTWLVEHMNAAQASLALGVCAEALRLTAEYTTHRKQFGQPIASFQAAGHRAADAYVDTDAIRLTARQAAWRLATGLPATAQTAVAKFWAADAGHRVVHAAQHLHGGVGVDRDYPLHRYFLYARQLTLTLGHGTEQLRRLGRILAADDSVGS